MKKNTILVVLISILAIGSIVLLNLSHKQADTVKTVKIGAIIPLTGAGSYVGQQNQLGLSMAADEINKKGGINGRKVEIIYEDSKTSPAEGVKAFQKLVDFDKVDMVISSLSAVSMAIAPQAEERQVPVFGIMTTAKDFVQNDWTFRYQPMTDLEIAPVIKTVDKLDLKSIGVIYSSDELGNSTYSAFKAEMEKENKKVYGESFDVKETDFNSMITKLTANDIDSIYIVGLDSHIVNIVKTLETLNYQGTILSLSPISLPSTRGKLSNFDKKIYAPAAPIYFGQLNEQATILKNNLQLKNVELNHFNALSYDVVELISKQLKNCKDFSSTGIKNSFEKNTAYSGVFGDLTINQNGHEIGYSFLPSVIEKGEISLYE